MISRGGPSIERLVRPRGGDHRVPDLRRANLLMLHARARAWPRAAVAHQDIRRPVITCVPIAMRRPNAVAAMAGVTGVVLTVGVPAVASAVAVASAPAAAGFPVSAEKRAG